MGDDDNEGDGLRQGFGKAGETGVPAKSDTDLYYDIFKDAVHIIVHGYDRTVLQGSLSGMEKYEEAILTTIKGVPNEGAQVKLAQDAWKMTAENTPLRQKLKDFVTGKGGSLDESYTFGTPTHNGYLQ